MIKSEEWIFVLKAGGSWKKIAPDFGPPHLTVKRGFSINGILYYLGWTGRHNAVVVSFDIRSEEFKMIQVPRMKRDKQLRSLKYKRLIDYGGKVTFLDQTNLRDKGIVDFWVLEDAENEEWSKKTLVLKPSQLHLVNNITLKVGRATQSGKVLLVPEDLVSPFYVLSYDMQNNDMRKIELEGIPHHRFRKDKANICFDLMFMDHSESVMKIDYGYL